MVIKVLRVPPNQSTDKLPTRYSREPKLHQFPDSFVRQGNGPMRPGHSRVTSKSQLQCVLQIMK